MSNQESLESFKQRLIDRFEADEILDELDISIEELLDRFEDKVYDYAEDEGWLEFVEDVYDET